MTHQAGIGTPLSRVDGHLKVTGQAHYAGEFPAERLLHGFAHVSRIAKGRIVSIDDSAARSVAGVIEIISHENRIAIPCFDKEEERDEGARHPFCFLRDAEIVFAGQPIALVVAESLEIARYAASLLVVDYAPETPVSDLKAVLDQAYAPKPTSRKTRGDVERGLAQAETRIAADYHLMPEHHNPIELFASTVVWEGDGSIIVYDKIQGVQRSHRNVCELFGFAEDEVTVLSPFVGGAFGSGLRPQYQLYLAVLAAKQLQRSVRVTLTRQQMFSIGYRPECVMHVELGADGSGRLTAIVNRAVTSTSSYEEYTENVVNWGGTLYRCDNALLDYKIARIDTCTPCDMRAPGAATGQNLFEIAMDELAYAAGIDPLALRRINYSDKDEITGEPYSSKALNACYDQGAERFGWDKRSHAPRSMRDGSELVGWGMATGIWEALMEETSARATLDADGRLEVASATADIGTGTYTMMTQVAAETTGIAVDRIVARLGDSRLPDAPVEGGSWTAASTGAAVQLACQALCEQLFDAAGALPGSPFAGVNYDDVRFERGRIVLAADPGEAVDLIAVMRGAGLDRIEAERTAKRSEDKEKGRAFNTHSAVFAEVRIDEQLGVIRVTRIVAAVAAGRIINPKTARSQILGGIVFGLGMALEEESLIDHPFGRFMTHNLADYHVPVHADIHDVDILFVEEHDEDVSPLGVKGVGEIGVVGTAAAIANAIHHATGKRFRELPITIDKLQ